MDYAKLNHNMQELKIVLGSAHNLERLLCHFSDWTVKHIGYTNLAIYLMNNESKPALGSYLKYTHEGTTALTDMLQDELLSSIHPGKVMMFRPREMVSAGDFLGEPSFNTCEILCSSGIYLGVVSVYLVAFRSRGFSEDDRQIMEMANGIFPYFLAAMNDSPEEATHQSRKQKPKDPADWWKNGGEPPF